MVDGGSDFDYDEVDIDLNKFKSEDIDSYLRLKDNGIIDDFKYVSTTQLKRYLRKNKVKKLNKKNWYFWK